LIEETRTRGKEMVLLHGKGGESGGKGGRILKKRRDTEAPTFVEQKRTHRRSSLL